MNVLIIPDVHGRTFWKEAVENTDAQKIIFLGDYVDPYYYQEGITDRQAIDVLVQIIDLKRSRPEDVVLLLGNHDMQYVSDIYLEEACSNRYCYELSQTLEDLFRNNHDFFQIAEEIKISKKNFLFTHAGVTQTWAKENEDLLPELTAENLNRLLQSDEGIRALAQVGRIRGGRYKSGSVVWADVDEMMESEPFPNCFQIFGHTQMKEPIVNSHFACLDCRQVFQLSDEGVFFEE